MYTYRDVDQIMDRLYLGNIQAAANIAVLKNLVFFDAYTL